MSNKEAQSYSNWHKFQSYFNVLNHIFNGAVACFMTFYLIKEWRDSFSLHVFLTTIGYQLLMTEAIMVFYTPNSWSFFHSHSTKKHLHWILQSIAAIFIITGNVIITVIRTTPHFKTMHAITGKREKEISQNWTEILIKVIQGLISMILLVLSMTQGVWTYFAFKLRSIIKPVTSKFLHSIMSIMCLVTGMVSLICGYRYGLSHDLFTTTGMEYSLIAVAIVTTILSLIGATKSVLSFCGKF